MSLAPAGTGTAGPPHVFICIPSGDQWWADTAVAFAGLLADATHRGIACTVRNYKGSMLTRQRNEMVRMALQAGASHVLMLDSDLVFPADTLARLLQRDRDVVGATYNRRVPPHDTLGQAVVPPPGTPPPDISKGGLIEFETLPGGCILYRTEVFRRLRWPWFFETYRRPGDPVQAFADLLTDNFKLPCPDPLRAALLATPGLADWLAANEAAEPAAQWPYLSEDYSFCRKLRGHGFRLWCDLDLTFQVAHLGQHTITCLPPKQGR